MADRVVLDANVAIAWCVNQGPELTRYASRVGRAIQAQNLRVVVPPTWDVEVGAALVRLHRNPAVDFTAARLEHALGVLERIPLDVEHTLGSLADVARAALMHRLSGFDAVYLETARSLGLTLATWYRALRQACMRARVPVFEAE